MQTLVADGRVTQEQLDAAIVLQTDKGATVSYHLVSMNAITADELVQFFVRRYLLDHWPRTALAHIAPEVIALLNPEMVKSLRVLPLRRKAQHLLIGMTDPSLDYVVDEVTERTDLSVSVAVVSEPDMSWAQSKYYNIRPKATLANFDQAAQSTVPIPLTRPRAEKDAEAESDLVRGSWFGTVEPPAQPTGDEDKLADDSWSFEPKRETRAFDAHLRGAESTEGAPLEPSPPPPPPPPMSAAKAAPADRDPPVLERVPLRLDGASGHQRRSGDKTAESPTTSDSTSAEIKKHPIGSIRIRSVSRTSLRPATEDRRSSSTFSRVSPTQKSNVHVISAPVISVRDAQESTAEETAEEPLVQTQTTTPSVAPETRQSKHPVTIQPGAPDPQRTDSSPGQPKEVVNTRETMPPGPPSIPAKRGNDAVPPRVANARPTIPPAARPTPNSAKSSSDEAPPRISKYPKTIPPSPPPQMPPRDRLISQIPPSAAPAQRKMSESEVIAKINAAENRDEIIDCTLEYLHGFCERAMFFVVRNKEIRGFAVAGELTNNQAIQSFWLPLTSPSILRRVVEDRRIHLGPLGRESGDKVLAAAFGGQSTRVLVLPIEIRERVVGLVYSDKIRITLPSWHRLKRLAELVGENFMRLILHKS